MTITKKALFFLGAAFFLTCSSTYIKVQAAQDMPDKSVQIGKKTTMQVKDSTLSTQNKAAWIWKSSNCVKIYRLCIACFGDWKRYGIFDR